MQYTSEKLQHSLKEHGLISSMSRRGNCLDNAVNERSVALNQSELTTVVIKQGKKRWQILLTISSRFIIRNDDIINWEIFHQQNMK